jgi:hypothetical protein
MLYGGYQPKFRPSKQCYILHFFFVKNEYVSIRKLRVTLEKNHSLKVSKYKLWKTLHELGFKYAKINGKEWFFSKVTRNFLIETYSFFEKNPTTILLIKSLSKLSKESLGSC